MLLSSLGVSIANVALPTLALAFDASFQQVQWVVLAYLLSVTTLIVSVGRLGDLLGRRRLLVGGIALFTVASAACALAPALWLLIAARAAQGLGGAVMMALALAFVADTVPKERSGSAMGLLGTMSAAGTALGPSVGGLLIAGPGWPAIFLVNLPLGLLAAILVYRFLPADRPTAPASKPGFDVPGTLLLAGTLALYALAVTVGRGSFGTINMALVLTAAVGAVLFVRVQLRSPSPLVRLALLREPAMSAGLAASSLVTTVVMATLVVGPFYLSGALALTPVQAGLVMTCGPLVAALTGVPAGRLVDRFTAQRVSLWGLCVVTVGTVALPLLPATWGVPGYVAPLAVITAGYALFQAANNTAILVRVASDQRGVVSGLLNLSRNLGLITGASVMGGVFEWGAASASRVASRPEAVAAGMRATFVVAAMLAAMALAMIIGTQALVRRRAAHAAE
ncbi:MFS transporter [soil metagenome]